MALDDLDRDYPAELSSWLSGALDIQIKSAEARAVRIVDVINDYRQLFVCLGIGHFVGPSSVPAFLAEAGLAVRRV
jgi:hypothetical protein